MKVKALVIAAVTGLFAASISMADMDQNSPDAMNPSASTDTMTVSRSTDAMTMTNPSNDGAKQDDVSKVNGQSED